MKRIFLLIAVLCMTINQASAEDNFLWGINGGLNISKAKGEGKGFAESGWETQEDQGFWVGLQFRFSFPITGLGLDFGANYSKEMASINVSQTKNVTDKLEYINVPVHLRYDLELPAVCSVIIPFAFAGPEVNYSLSDLEDLAHESPHNIKHDQVSAKTERALEANKFVWKMDLGFGVILFSHLQLAYNYAIPLTESFKFNEETYKDSEANFKMGTHRIGATIFF